MTRARQAKSSNSISPVPGGAGGRLQAFGIAWDSQPKDQSGQRWFELYPGQPLRPGDPLRWIGRD
jgi:hypothetical protein